MICPSFLKSVFTEKSSMWTGVLLRLWFCCCFFIPKSWLLGLPFDGVQGGSAHITVLLPLGGTWLFSLAALMMTLPCCSSGGCWCVLGCFLCVCPAWGLGSCLDLRGHSFPDLRTFWAHISSNIFPTPHPTISSASKAPTHAHHAC